MNETILPTDFRQAGQIEDDRINTILVNPLPQGAIMHAVIDACHSGTAMDLPFYTKINKSTGAAEWIPTYRYGSKKWKVGEAVGKMLGSWVVVMFLVATVVSYLRN